MAERRTNILFEDIFDIKDMDKGGKRFDRGVILTRRYDVSGHRLTWSVSRIFASSENYEMELILDVNSEIYPLEVSTKFSLVLAENLNLDGQPSVSDEDVYDPSGRKSLADKYEYVMFGKVFKFADEKTPTPKLWVYFSILSVIFDHRSRSFFHENNCIIFYQKWSSLPLQIELNSNYL